MKEFYWKRSPVLRRANQISLSSMVRSNISCLHLAVQTVVAYSDQAQHRLQYYDKHDPSGELYTHPLLVLSFLCFLDTLRWSWVQGPSAKWHHPGRLQVLILWYDIVTHKLYAAELQNNCQKKPLIYFFLNLWALVLMQSTSCGSQACITGKRVFWELIVGACEEVSRCQVHVK